MKRFRSIIGILCFFLFVFSNCSNTSFSQQSITNNSTIEDIAPEPDYTSFRNHLHYPEIANKARVEGPMAVRVFIDSLGKLTKYQFVVSLGPLFEKSVIDALQNTSFTPARKNGVAYSSYTTIPVKFRISGFIQKIKYNFHEQVIFCLSALMKIDEKNYSEYLYLRGKEHFRNREYDFANEDYNLYTSLDTANNKLFYEDALWEDCVHSLPKDTLSLDSLVLRGNILVGYFLFDKALEIFNRVIHKDSTHRTALISRAEMLYTTYKEYEESISDYSRVIAINKNDTISYVNIGWNYYLLGDMNKCIEYSERAIELNHNQFTARYNRALAYLRLGNIDKAQDLYKQTIQLQKSQKITPNYGAIEDLKDLVYDKIMEKECTKILKDIFNLDSEYIARHW